MKAPIRAGVTALFVLFALVASACGSDSPTDTTAPSGGTDAAGTQQNGTDADNTQQNGTDDASDTSNEPAASDDSPTSFEILEVATGATTTIADTVTGDRPVLLWFWAPH